MTTTTTTLRPNATGTNSGISSQYPDSTSPWDKVDEVSADEDTTYIVVPGGTYAVSTFHSANPTHTGKITDVSVYTRIAASWEGVTAYVKPAIYVGGTLYYGTEQTTVGTSYVTKSHSWGGTNPKTATGWLWADIDAIEFGAAIKAGAGDWCKLTQVYLVITSKPKCRAGSTVVGL